MSVDGKAGVLVIGEKNVILRRIFLGVKMGRIPKLVKERALREQKEQEIQREAELAESQSRSDEERARGSSYSSSSSDRSVENYDPDTMETGKQQQTTESSRKQRMNNPRYLKYTGENLLPRDAMSLMLRTENAHNRMSTSNLSCAITFIMNTR